MLQPAATIIAALIAAFLGSLLGAVFAFSRFKKERAFDRQLDWYERMLKAIYELAQRIEIAATFQSELKTNREHLVKVWRDVQLAHLDLDSCANQAALYGSAEAAQLTTKIASSVQKVANEMDAFDVQVPPKTRHEKLELIERLPDRLRSEAKPLAREARRHLGLIR